MSPVRLACPSPGGAATRSARCAGPARFPRAAARLPAPPPACASGRTRPATPAARRSPPRSSAAGPPRYRAHRPGWRGAGRERLAFPGAARPWVRDDGRSAPPAVSSPAPAPVTRPGLPPQGAGEEREAAARAAAGGPEAGRVLVGGPALPEGKAGRAGRGVPGGDRRRCPASRWPMGRAGLPPGTAGIHPRLRPPRQVARPGPGTDLAPGPEPRAGRAGARLARMKGRAGRGPGTAKGERWRVPRGHTPPSSSARRRAARRGHALAAGSALWCSKDLSWRGESRVPPLFSLTLHKSGFDGLFLRAPRK